MAPGYANRPRPARGTGALEKSVPTTNPQPRPRKPGSGSLKDPGTASLKKPKLPAYIEYQLPPMIKSELAKLSPEQINGFIEGFNRKRKNMTSGYISWILLGSHYAYLGRWGLQLLHWGTFGMMGMWWLIDALRLPSLIRGHNRDVATAVLRDIKVIAS